MIRKFSEKELIIASHNQGKIKEIYALLCPFELRLESAASLNLPEPEENKKTYLENALIKAKACFEATGWPALSDDSGIEVDALLGQPGVDTAPYTKAIGGREKVFTLWQGNEAIRKNNRACFVCVQVLFWPDGHYEHFLGRINGRLIFPPRGLGGHGYDPVFVPDGQHRTVAEMSLEEKNFCSHRFLALKQLIDACIKQP